MALVLTVKMGKATAYVYDDAYRDCTPEEMEQRYKKVDQAVNRIMAVPENRARYIESLKNGNQPELPNVEVKWE